MNNRRLTLDRQISIPTHHYTSHSYILIEKRQADGEVRIEQLGALGRLLQQAIKVARGWLLLVTQIALNAAEIKFPQAPASCIKKSKAYSRVHRSFPTLKVVVRSVTTACVGAPNDLYSIRE